MNEDLVYYITNHAGSLSVQELLINFFSALVIGFIYFCHTVFHTRELFITAALMYRFGCLPLSQRW